MESDTHRPASLALLIGALLAFTPSSAYAGGIPGIALWIGLGILLVGTALVAMLVGAIVGGFRSSKATRAKYPDLKGKSYFMRWAFSFILRSNAFAFRSFMVLLAMWVGLFAGAFLYWFWIDFVCKQ